MKRVSKNNVARGLRKLGLLCVILIGFMAIVGSDSDDAKDLVDIDFDEDTEISLESVTVTKDQFAASALGDNCATTSVKAELKKIEDDIEDLDKIDVESVILNYITVEYLAQWSPVSVDSLTCRLTISGEENTSIAEMAINNPSGSQTLNLTPEQIEVINYYLKNRAKEFTYCVECDNDALIDEYTVTYTAELGVTIKGEF